MSSGFYHVRHKLGCTITEYETQNMIERLGISYFGRRGIVQSIFSENKGTDQQLMYYAADLRLCFRICKKQVFS